MRCGLDNNAQEKLEKLVYARAIALLARREHSRHELLSKLSVKFGGNEQVIAGVLDRISERGYQSDSRFAEAYARMRQNAGFGLSRIAMELSCKGVSDSIIHIVLDELRGNTDVGESPILRVWEKKFGAAPVDIKSKVKQQNFLRYRGYSVEEINLLFQFLSNHHAS